MNEETVQQRLCSVEGCDRPVDSRGWCQLHYLRWYHKGDVGGAESTHCYLSLDDPGGIERHLLGKRRIDPNGCWVYTGIITDMGYGRKSVNKRLHFTHRLSAWLWKGMPLDGQHQALHRCDNPPCFNPDHLFVGTQSDNMLDMLAKGRAWTNKMTAETVREIRAADEPSTINLARLYGLTPQSIRDIRRRRTWKHVA